MKKQIVVENSNIGYHNLDLQKTNDRLMKGQTYKDLSTIMVVPSRGTMPTKVVQNWMSLMPPMNQKFTRIFMVGYEVGDAYNQAIQMILDNQELSKWKYILTMEDDNMPPPDGILKLYEGIKEYDVVGGLYWTKGEGGQPMIYGDPHSIPLNFIPQLPKQGQLHWCNGLGMGFNLFKLDIFKDTRIPKPWFKTCQEYTPGVGCKAYTQDLYFYENIRKLGYRVACDTRILVGHYDVNTDICW
jgi:glycosyltransferase involved in cell wall biosynthesis